jgi:hypothetical protein
MPLAPNNLFPSDGPPDSCVTLIVLLRGGLQVNELRNYRARN